MRSSSAAAAGNTTIDRLQQSFLDAADGPISSCETAIAKMRGSINLLWGQTGGVGCCQNPC